MTRTDGSEEPPSRGREQDRAIGGPRGLVDRRSVSRFLRGWARRAIPRPVRCRSVARWSGPTGRAGQRGDASLCSVECQRAWQRPERIRPQDIDADSYTADFITRVDFDGNLLGEDNASNRDRKEVRGAVYYSLVRGARHDFIGYFFYHAEDTSGIFDGGGHEHDVEGIVVSYNRCTKHLDALLANQHGSYASYVAPDNPSLRPPVDRRGVKLTDGRPDDEGFYAPGRTFTLQDQQTYDALAVGVEANTHAVWGRWDSTCVIGPTGHPDGCDPDEHGGDGLIYRYDNFAEVPQPPYAQYPAWPFASYELIDIAGLWDLAHQPETCGQADPNRSPAEPPPSFLFACHDDPVPWDTLNSEGEDAGNLPWSWGPSAVLDHVCDTDAPNMLLHPAEVFAGFFEHAAGYFVHWYLDNPFADSSTCT